MVINRNSSGRNKTFLSPLLLSLETTRRLCRRVVSEALPAIFPHKKAYIKTYKKNTKIPLVNPLLKSVSCVPPPMGTGYLGPVAKVASSNVGGLSRILRLAVNERAAVPSKTGSAASPRTASP